jgi:GxxExxY protein
VAAYLLPAIAMLAPLDTINGITSRIIKCAIEAHRTIGAGLLENVYASCLAHEMTLQGLRFERECMYPVIYRGVILSCSYKIDLLIEDLVVVELKSVETVLPVHRAQLLTEMKLANMPAGLLLNFKVPMMKEGITRLLNREALKTE